MRLDKIFKFYDLGLSIYILEYYIYLKFKTIFL